MCEFKNFFYERLEGYLGVLGVLKFIFGKFLCMCDKNV